MRLSITAVDGRPPIVRDPKEGLFLFTCLAVSRAHAAVINLNPLRKRQTRQQEGRAMGESSASCKYHLKRRCFGGKQVFRRNVCYGTFSTAANNA